MTKTIVMLPLMPINGVYIVGDTVRIVNLTDAAIDILNDVMKEIEGIAGNQHMIVIAPIKKDGLRFEDHGVIAKVGEFISSSDGKTYSLEGIAVGRARILGAVKKKATCVLYGDNDIPVQDKEFLLAPFKDILKKMYALAYDKSVVEMAIERTDKTNDLHRLGVQAASVLASLDQNPQEEKLDILTSKSQLEYYGKLVNLIEAVYDQLMVKIQESERRQEMKKEKGNSLRNRYEEIKNFIPEEARKFFEKDFQNLQDPYSKADQHLEFLLSLPWGKYTHDIDNLKVVRDILDADHYGLNKIKERIMEFIAVRKLNPKGKAPILTFAGPPGVGKTSLGKSIARAMGRKFIRTALGGIRDEGEIRGHSSTYVGAQEGRILRELVNAGSSNPVFMIDEVDKLMNVMGVSGDPSAALLEVLDPEQNYSFKDTYAKCPFDLSQVFFICTANVIENIPSTLRDRMEIIMLPSYSEKEKIQIARNFLVPKQKKETGVDKIENIDIALSDEQIMKLIERTYEAGVRKLEQQISSLFRKIAVQHFTEGEIADVEKIIGQLGPPARHAMIRKTPPGVANGLAYTGRGGDILRIEVICNKSAVPEPKISMTGNLGDTMKESGKIALSVIRQINKDNPGFDFAYKMFHIHVPEGAIPKDGPSAGITMAVALQSSVINKPIKAYVTFTGEITLEGEILPIGGLEEKIPAAIKAGAKHVILPEENKADMERLSDFAEIKKALKIHYVKTIHDALKIIFKEN